MHSLRPPVVALTLLITTSAALGVLVGVVASRGSVVASWAARPDVILTSVGAAPEAGLEARTARAVAYRDEAAPRMPGSVGAPSSVPPISLSGMAFR